MNIRSARRQDYEQLLNLLRQLNPDDPSPGSAVREAFEAILQAEHLKIIVAEEDGKLLASCYLNLIPNMTRGGKSYAVIENVVTDEAHRKRGIGQGILKHALQVAWDADCYKVMLMSGRKDPAVQAFYLKCGFVADAKQAYVQRRAKN